MLNCFYVSVGVYTTCTRRGQKRVLYLLELELQMILNCWIFVLETKPGTSGRAASSLNYRGNT